MKQRRLTPFGVEVKKKLLDLNMTQAEFCREHNIPQNRLTEILTGIRPNYKHRELVIEILGIDYVA